MTGIIRSLDAATASGSITTDEGLLVAFSLSAVMTYDVSLLTLGRAVSFDLEGGKYYKVLNVCVQLKPQAANAKQKRLDTATLRYLGFEQRRDRRAYLFEKHTPGTRTLRFAVETDLTLFAKHHVGLQEGPALCLQLLMEQLEDTAALASFTSSLSDREMLAYLASRPVSRNTRHILPESGAASHPS